jgi:hypothetical protein
VLELVFSAYGISALSLPNGPHRSSSRRRTDAGQDLLLPAAPQCSPQHDPDADQQRKQHDKLSTNEDCRPRHGRVIHQPKLGGGVWHASCAPGGMGPFDRQRQIAILERLVESERELLDDPRCGIPAARVIAQARHELAVLRETAPRHHRLAMAAR